MRTLDEQEMIDILETIARDGKNGAARIAAIKALREMRDDGKESAFADLDGPQDELAPRRNYRVKAR